MQANTNYVITDPKSEVLLSTGGYLKSRGYDVRGLKLVNLDHSQMGTIPSGTSETRTTP